MSGVGCPLAWILDFTRMVPGSFVALPEGLLLELG